MTILYEYTAGCPPMLWLSIGLWILAGIVLIAMIIFLFWSEGDPTCWWLLLCAGMLVGFGFMSMKDTRHQEVKALMDNDISWTEVNQRYQFVKQEGDIYTFIVREETNEGS